MKNADVQKDVFQAFCTSFTGEIQLKNQMNMLYLIGMKEGGSDEEKPKKASEIGTL